MAFISQIKIPSGTTYDLKLKNALTLNGTTYDGSSAQSFNFLTSHQDISGKADKVSITAGTAGTTSATSGSSLAVPYVTVNAQGIVTGYGTHTHTISGFLTSASTLDATKLSGTIPIASIPTGTSSTTVALGNHTHSYLPLSGGTLTGDIYIHYIRTQKGSLSIENDTLPMTYITSTTENTGFGYKNTNENPVFVIDDMHSLIYCAPSYTISGNGNKLTSLNASNISSGTLSSDRLPIASTTLGAVKTTSTVTSNSGYTACPIIDGVPYYKDTNTTYTLAGLMGSSAKGSATQPVYWTGSAWANTTYALNKTVPSDAVFTDTNTWRGIQNNLTSTSTTDSLSAYQGKVLSEKIDTAQSTVEKTISTTKSELISSLNEVKNTLGTISSGSASSLSTKADVSTYTNGGKITLDAGTYIIIATGTFSSSSSSGHRRLRIYNNTASSSVDQVNIYTEYTTVLNACAVVKITASSTFYAQLSSSVAISGNSSTIKAVQLK
jgi:hypothetical protein